MAHSDDTKYVLEGVVKRIGFAQRKPQRWSAEALEAAVAGYQEKIKAGVAFGELYQPGDDSKPSKDLVVSIKDVSHRVTNLEMNGANVYATFEVLDTPRGKVLWGLIDKMRDMNMSGLSAYWSGEGSGTHTFNKDGTEYYEITDYRIVAINLGQALPFTDELRIVSPLISEEEAD